MKDYAKEHELNRQKVWIEAWVNTASANDCKSTKTSTAWADDALKAFDQRFKAFQEE